MPKSYKQINYKQRVAIEVYIKEGKSLREIARLLDRNVSTVSREIQKNKGGPSIKHYRSEFANTESRFRRSRTGRKNRQKKPEIFAYVEKNLREGWSPEQISRRIGLDYPGWKISIETIYQHVADHWLEDLLPSRRPRRRKRRTDKKRREVIPNRVGIEMRGLEADARTEVGHFEIDAMVSHHNVSSLNVIVDRQSRLTKMSKLENMKPQTTQEAIIRRLKEYPDGYCKTTTYDNGFENRNHEAVNAEIGVKSYFCNPYSSWEKGTVENTNGLIRRFFPKGTDFSKITEEEVKIAENKLNNRPRKCLGFLTPNEVYQKSITISGCCT